VAKKIDFQSSIQLDANAASFVDRKPGDNGIHVVIDQGSDRPAATRMEDLILVSVDDHLMEPPDMFSAHMPARFKDRAPRIVKVNTTDTWLLDGRRFPMVGLNAVVGRPRQEYGMEPVSYEQMRRGCFDIHARVADMNVNGVLGSLCFPSFPGFGGGMFLGVPDKQLALATVRAYNDWHVSDWCGSAPGRFIPLGLMPLWDVNLMVKEFKRLAKIGVHAVTFPDNPAFSKLPSLHSDYWDPFWKVCADNKVVICCHIGTGAGAPYASDESPVDAWITSMPIAVANSAADWLFGPMWKKFPDLRMALSEGGIGWIPYFLERADFTYKHHHAWTFSDFGGELPSDTFRRHVITCFIDDQFGLRNLDEVGIDMVTWECDYPHSDCTWPESVEILWQGVKNLPQDRIEKITHSNAMREFSYDPFSVLGRENCTVEALRAQAKDVDMKLITLGGLRSADAPHKPVTSGEVMAKLRHQMSGAA
jgi:predicted TIM-barrel fold metal-dependent hydrolase